MKKIDKHPTAVHNLYYSKVVIDQLIKGLKKMEVEEITIKQFHQVLNQVSKLHKVQMEMIEIEESLYLPCWNGDFYIREQ